MAKIITNSEAGISYMDYLISKEFKDWPLGVPLALYRPFGYDSVVIVTKDQEENGDGVLSSSMFELGTNDGIGQFALVHSDFSFENESDIVLFCSGCMVSGYSVVEER